MAPPRYHSGVLKYSWLALCVLLAFGAVVALLPERSAPNAGAGVTLSGVKLRLYPQQDAQAEWRFEAQNISYDPLRGETEVVKPSKGERILNGKLDMTIRTERLIIDSNDDLRTQQATLYIPSECTTLELQGDAQRPVRIQQSVGYSAPIGKMTSPSIKAEIANLTSSFQLDVQGSFQGQTQFQSNPDEVCDNGRLVKKNNGGSP